MTRQSLDHRELPPRYGRRLSRLALLVLVLACRTSPRDDSPPPQGSAEGAGATVSDAPADPTWETIGESVEGRPIESVRFGAGPAPVLLLATIHGDEAAGTPLMQELARRLALAPELVGDGAVRIVPVVNPDGVARATRHNARGVDLNRNFPAANFRPGARRGAEPLSEPESRTLAELIERERPSRVLSFHQAANLLDWDGPGDELTRALGAVSPLPVERMGSRPGSLGSWVGLDLGIPIVTVELPASASALDGAASWALYGDLVLQALRFPEPLRPAPPAAAR